MLRRIFFFKAKIVHRTDGLFLFDTKVSAVSGSVEPEAIVQKVKVQRGMPS